MTMDRTLVLLPLAVSTPEGRYCAQAVHWHARIPYGTGVALSLLSRLAAISMCPSGDVHRRKIDVGPQM